MATTISETTKNANQASDASEESKEVATEGDRVVKETLSGIISISKVVDESAKTVEILGESSEKIGKIIVVIDDIADQTNLLALNAAIEAARAGEHGRGFAVVADEVRKLAERTTTATKEIEVMIKKIQEQTHQAVQSMRKGSQETEKGKLLAEQAGASLNKIITSSDIVLDAINQVASASEEQSITASDVSKSVDGINAVTQESTTGIENIVQATNELHVLTEDLNNIVNRFKTNDHELQVKNYSESYIEAV